MNLGQTRMPICSTGINYSVGISKLRCTFQGKMTIYPVNKARSSVCLPRSKSLERLSSTVPTLTRFPFKLINPLFFHNTETREQKTSNNRIRRWSGTRGRKEKKGVALFLEDQLRPNSFFFFLFLNSSKSHIPELLSAFQSKLHAKY